ncbi:uncharacterized protein LOC62_03G004349 [Vanrija pseudolonga]|uniref:Uncharacterized protein n=1 Tax=Vanrija pseudolonga TaxID=143232 RepID=A0AAF0YAI0_9TREE|nr:hypothetical protein LOC62_03G004349 [Vanrija pseudolonga]
MPDEDHQRQRPSTEGNHHTAHVGGVPSATGAANTVARAPATVDATVHTVTTLYQVIAGIQRRLDANDATIKTITRLQAQNQAELDALQRRLKAHEQALDAVARGLAANATAMAGQAVGSAHAEGNTNLEAISHQIRGNGETLDQIYRDIERVGRNLQTQSTLLSASVAERATAAEVLGQLVTRGQARHTSREVAGPAALEDSSPRLPGCCPDWAAGNCAGQTCPRNLLHACALCSTADKHVHHQSAACPKHSA